MLFGEALAAAFRLHACAAEVFEIVTKEIQLMGDGRRI
jgi:hypothetical protein